MSKQRKNGAQHESKSTSSAYKSRTDPPEYFVMVYLDGREPEDAIIEDGIEYERTDHIPIDWDSIPSFVKDDLATAALEDYLEFIKRPDAQEILDANRESLQCEGSTLLDPRLP